MLKEIKKNPNYLVDEQGFVYNLKGDLKFTRPNRDGYNTVNLWNNNKPTCYAVHRLVAEAFIPNPDNKPCVNHKDCNKMNNRVDNLEWCTYSENLRHAIDNDLITYHKGENVSTSKITDEQAHEVCRMMQEGYRNKEIVNKLKISNDTVKNIRGRRCWNHISDSYDFTQSKQGLSEESVRWVCNKIVEGFTNREIVSLATNEGITKSIVSKIKCKICFKDIVKDYNF